MSKQTSPLGWIVAVRAPNQADEYLYASTSHPRDAEDQVRDAVQATWQTTVEAVRELAQEEIDALHLPPEKVIYAQRK